MRRILTVVLLVGVALLAGRTATRASPGTSELIVFSQWTGAGPGGDGLGAIWAIRPDGSGLVKLRGPCTDCYSTPRLSPDRKRIAYADYTSDGDNAVFVMKADGTGAKAVCVARCNYPVAWSPDGRRLAVGTETTTGGGVDYGYGVLDLRTRQPHVFRKLPFSASSLQWSPDGRWILASDPGYLWRMRSDGTGVRLVARRVSDARWSADGKTLLVAGENGVISTMPVAGGRQTPLKDVQRGIASLVWSPNGREIAYAAGGLFVLDVASGRTRRLDAATHVCSKPGDELGAGQTLCGDVDWR